MGTIPTVPTFTAGAVLTASDLNALGTAINFWASPPRAQLYRSAALSLSNSTWTLLSFDAETYDTDVMHDNATNPSRLVIKTAGYYRLAGAISYANNNTGTRDYSIRLNAAGSVSGGTEVFGLTIDPPSAGQGVCVLPPLTVALAVNDYIEAFGYQSSGGSLTVMTGASNTFLQAELVGKV